MFAALLALAASGPVTVAPERLGEIPDDCYYGEEEGADGFDLVELERIADCLVDLEPAKGGDLARGVDLYRLALELSQTNTELPPSVGDLRFKVVRAFGENGDVDGMLREAEALRVFLDRAPSLRCEFFDRLAVDLEHFEAFAAAEALSSKFDLGSCARYVPRDGWPGTSGAAFYEHWYGNQLLAMGEKPFSDPAALAGFTQRFRLTVVPSFSPAHSVRIDELPNGRFRLHWALLDGAGGYAPGEIAKSGDRLLDAREVFLISRALRRADLANVPMVVSEPPERDSKTGEQTLIICVDGTQWLFESLTEQGPTFSERSFCGHDDEGLFELIETTHHLVPPDVFDYEDD